MSKIGALPRRVLIVGLEDFDNALRGEKVRTEAVRASSVVQACFMLDCLDCETAIVDGRTHSLDCNGGLAALASRVAGPLILVSDPSPELVIEGFRHGVIWLPAEAVRQHPVLLEAAVEKAIRDGEARQEACGVGTQLRECRARVDRLMDLLWEVAPGIGLSRWFSQRHMLDRMGEELARVRRRGVPLSLVLGEVRPTSGGTLPVAEAGRLAGWVADRVGNAKRRCDVAGQYGLTGFMLLLPQAERSEAEGACQRLRRVLGEPPHTGLPALQVRFGVASVPEDQATVAGLLRTAEERLEAAGQERGRF